MYGLGNNAPWLEVIHVFVIINMSTTDESRERRTVNRGDGGSIPPTVVSKLRQFRSPHICLCLSEETLKAGGPFCGVYARGSKRSHT